MILLALGIGGLRASLSPTRQRVRNRTASGCLAHLFDCHRPPGPNNVAQDGRGPLRQQDHTAVGMHEEVEPVTTLQPEMLADELRNCRLPFAGDCGLHGESPYHYIPMCKTLLHASIAGGSAILLECRVFLRL